MNVWKGEVQPKQAILTGMLFFTRGGTMFLDNPMSKFNKIHRLETSKTQKIGDGLLLALPHCFNVVFSYGLGMLRGNEALQRNRDLT